MIAGDVVLLRFPFSDLSAAKLRPGVVIAVVDRSEFIVCQITSKRKSDRFAIELTAADFSAGGLKMASYVRPAKLFTAARVLLVRRVGRLTLATTNRVRDAVARIVRGA